MAFDYGFQQFPNVSDPIEHNSALGVCPIGDFFRGGRFDAARVRAVFDLPQQAVDSPQPAQQGAFVIFGQGRHASTTFYFLAGSDLFPSDARSAANSAICEILRTSMQDSKFIPIIVFNCLGEFVALLTGAPLEEGDKSIWRVF